jgi:pilus assembly protein CpaC
VSTIIARGLSISQGASSNHNASTNSYISGGQAGTTAQTSPFLFNVAAAGAGLFTGSFVSGSSLLNLSLNIAKDSSLATVLAQPNLSTLSGKKAEFLSGGQFPYVSNCAVGAGSACTTSFKSYGIGLEFTPIVLDGNRINLSTHISVSYLTNTANQVLQSTATNSLTGTTSVPGLPSPSLDVREAQSTIELADGQTMSIAGLISQKEINQQQATPGLADIPWLGAAFKNRSSETDKRELVILITPHLVKPLPPSQIRLPTDNYVQPNDVDFYLLGKMDAKKPENRTVQTNTYDPTTGGTTGQFGHQINAGGPQ